MFRSCCVFLSLFLFQVALATNLKFDIPGRCPDKCSTKIEQIFQRCIGQFDKGCAVKFCGDNKVECGLKSGIPDMIFPSEQIQIRNIKPSVPFKLNVGFGEKGSIGIGSLDIYFLIDGTGSMGSAIETFSQAINSLGNKLNMKTDIAIGGGVYRDEEELMDGFRHIQDVTTDLSEARSSLRKIVAKGGLDAEEANLVALYKIAKENPAKWRDGTKRVVIMYGDYVGHEPTCAIPGLTLTREIVIDALNEAGITLIAVSTEFGNLNEKTSPFGCTGSGGIISSRTRGRQTSDITDATGGIFTKLSDDTDPAGFEKKIIRALERVTKELTIFENTCSPFAKIKTEPALPTDIPGIGGEIKIQVTVRNCFTGIRKCKLTFAGDGTPYPAIAFKLSMLRGC